MQRIDAPVRVGTAVLLMAVAILGCATHFPGTGLAPPQDLTCKSDRTAWVARVSITDPLVHRPGKLEDSLSLSIREFLEAGHVFRRVKLLPGKPAADDLILHFRFPRFYQVRDVYPPAIPLAIVTFDFYTIFGGPLFLDRSRLTGILNVETPKGDVVVSDTEKVSRQVTVSIWSTNYALPTGIKPRTQLIQELVTNVCGRLGSG